ncbi:MAG: hypothetical protein ACD_19C00355G0004 [uncultured bacterium]|nr:MAG: hypothetical protein ACD_19C00355G0004 [uncultured bacterium]
MAQQIELQDYAYYQVWWKINRLILRQLEFSKLVQEVVDAVFDGLDAHQMGYAFVSLLIPQENILKNIALSRTGKAQELMNLIPVPYLEKVTFPVNDETSFVSRSFRDGKSYVSKNWSEVYTKIDGVENIQVIQEKLGIKTIFIFPLISGRNVLGVLRFDLMKNEEEMDGHERMLLEGIADATAVALENSRMYSKLQELDQLKDEFLSLAAHELRTPMTAIKGYSYELMKSPNLDVKGKEYIERVYKSTERLVNLVNDMLDVSRIESGRIDIKPENIEVTKIIANVVAEFSGKVAEKNLELTFVPLGQTTFTAVADSAKLIQVMTNLLGNSVKFTPDGGKIGVTIQLKSGFIEVQVTDTGIGIDKEDLSKLFGKFVRAKTGSGIQGTGLGLYLSKKLVNLMGGDLWAKSNGAGSGSTFGFTLKQV